MNMLDVMTSHVITIHEKDSVATARKIMKDANTRHLVVTSADGGVVGIVSDRDCKLAMQSPFVPDDSPTHELAENISIQRIMAHAPHCVEPHVSVQEAAQMMIEHRISALPVVNDGMLMGIVTTTDLLKVLVTPAFS